MKKLIFGLISLTVVVSASLKYECSRYVNGEWQGYIDILADSKTEAEEKAYKKYKEVLKMKVDYVKCK